MSRTNRPASSHRFQQVQHLFAFALHDQFHVQMAQALKAVSIRKPVSGIIFRQHHPYGSPRQGG